MVVPFRETGRKEQKEWIKEENRKFLTGSVTNMPSLYCLLVIQRLTLKETVYLFICVSEVGGVVRARTNYLGSMTNRCIYIHGTLSFYLPREYKWVLYSFTTHVSEFYKLFFILIDGCLFLQLKCRSPGTASCALLPKDFKVNDN